MMTVNLEQQEQFEAFYQGHTGHAVILLPGLCGSELELGAIPRLIKQSGHSVIIPRIPGYSAHTGITSYSAWIETIDVLAQSTLKSHSSVSLVGLSMGATLCLAVAQQNQSIQSLVLLSPVLTFDGWAIPWYHPLLSILYKLGIRNWVYREGPPYGVKNHELSRRIENAVKANKVSELGAAHLPAKHLYQSLRLVSAAKRNLSEVVSDFLIIHSINDETASPKNPDLILQEASSETKKIIWLSDCYHIITVDNEREIVVNETNNFINQILDKVQSQSAHITDNIGLVIKERNRD
jgi:carboxylesterase